MTRPLHLLGCLLVLAIHLWPNAIGHTLDRSLAPLRILFGPPPPPPESVVLLPEGAATVTALAAVERRLRGLGVAAVGIILDPDQYLAKDDRLLRALEGFRGKAVLCMPTVAHGDAHTMLVPPPLLERVALAGYHRTLRDLAGRPHSHVLAGLVSDGARRSACVEIFAKAREVPDFNVLYEGKTLRLRPLSGQSWKPLEVSLDEAGALPLPARGDELVQVVDDLDAAEGLDGAVVLLGAPDQREEALALAAMTAGLLGGTPDQPISRTVELALLLLGGAFLVVIGATQPPHRVARSTATLIFAWSGLAAAAFGQGRLVLPMARPILAFLLLGVAGLLRYRYRPLVGVRIVASSEDGPGAAQEALSQGVDLLREGRIDDALPFFQRVARLDTDLKEQSQYFLSLVLLRRGEVETAATLISAMDFGRLAPEETYHLAEELERRGDLGTAHTVFERIAEADLAFRDVGERIAELEARLQDVSEDEVVEMMVRRVVERRYHDLERIGRGGMGFVYRAVEPRAGGRTVALKVLSPFLANNDDVRRRFLQEAALASALEHPNVVRIFRVHDKSIPYYAMEFIGALSVKEVLAGVGTFPLTDAVELVGQVCEGLGIAHAQGVVHRDIKPENLMLAEGGVVKLIDFGIARVLESSALTQTKKRMGTPEYMSPEQARAEPVDHRSDLYSLAIVLYELLAGAPPFRSLKEQVQAPLPPLDPALGVPSTVATFLTRATAKTPDDRPGSAEDFALELREALEATS